MHSKRLAAMVAARKRLASRANEALYLAKTVGRALVRTWEPAKPKLVSA
ncbi:hypothetical protein HFC70_24445 [Agrobacterium sp. a22-2]|nr:hypothetical protein [Agrobacterium sp. a22-2]NKN39501.1 hypothetical protein [Agrobacterium sp. a22-2]